VEKGRGGARRNKGEDGIYKDMKKQEGSLSSASKERIGATVKDNQSSAIRVGTKKQNERGCRNAKGGDVTKQGKTKPAPKKKLVLKEKRQKGEKEITSKRLKKKGKKKVTRRKTKGKEGSKKGGKRKGTVVFTK